MDELLFVDSTFVKDNTSRYKLSIQLCLDGFSFSILNSSNKCLALFQSKKLNSDSENSSIDVLKDKIRNCDYLNLTYKHTSIIWLTKKASLIPSELFSEALAKNSFQLCHSLLKSEIISWNVCPELNAHIVFALPSDLPVFLESQFPESKTSHQTLSFYQRVLNHSINNKHPKVFVEVYDNFFDVFIPDSGQKFFTNNFSFKDETDIVYFILNIYKHQKLNTEYSQLHISGKIDETSKTFQILKRYIKEIRMDNIPSESFSKSNVSNSTYNQFTKLLNPNLCE